MWKKAASHPSALESTWRGTRPDVCVAVNASNRCDSLPHDDPRPQLSPPMETLFRRSSISKPSTPVEGTLSKEIPQNIQPRHIYQQPMRGGMSFSEVGSARRVSFLTTLHHELRPSHSRVGKRPDPRANATWLRVGQVRASLRTLGFTGKGGREWL